MRKVHSEFALNLRESDFLAFWAQTGFDESKRADCMRKAGYQATRKIPNSIQGLIIKHMDRMGMKIPDLVKKHAEGLDAVDPKFKSPDYNARFKYLDAAYKIRKVYPDPKIEIDKREVSFQINMDVLEAAERASGEKIIDLLPEDCIEAEERVEEAVELRGQDE